MQTLKWRIVGDKTLVSDIIKFVSRGPVSHAEFILDGPTVDSTAMPNQYTLGARADGGVQIRPINYATFSLELRYLANIPDEQYVQVMSFLKAQLGKPYNYIDILAILADRDWRDSSSWICSELWAAAVEAGGMIGKIDSSINLFTPEDVLVLSSAMWQRYPTPLAS